MAPAQPAVSVPWDPERSASQEPRPDMTASLAANPDKWMPSNPLWCAPPNDVQEQSNMDARRGHRNPIKPGPAPMRAQRALPLLPMLACIGLALLLALPPG